MPKENKSYMYQYISEIWHLLLVQHSVGLLQGILQHKKTRDILNPQSFHEVHRFHLLLIIKCDRNPLTLTHTHTTYIYVVVSHMKTSLNNILFSVFQYLRDFLTRLPCQFGYSAHISEHISYLHELRKEVMQKRQPGDKTLMWSLVLVIGFDCLKHVSYLSMWRFLNDSCHEEISYWVHHQVTYYVLEGLSDCLTGVPSFHDHGSLHILSQFGRSALQEAFGALCLGFSVGTQTHGEMTNCQSHTIRCGSVTLLYGSPFPFPFSPMSCLPQLSNKGNINSQKNLVWVFSKLSSKPADQTPSTKTFYQNIFTTKWMWVCFTMS